MENLSPKAEQEKKKIVIVDTSEGMENEVRDVADANLTAFKSELRGPRGFLKKIWNYGLAEEYYRQKEIAKVRKKVLKSDNIYAGEDDDRSAHVQTMSAIVESFSAEYEELLNKKDTGAKKEILGESLAEKEVKLQIKGLIRSYVAGTLDEANFREEKNRIFQELKGARKDVVDKGAMFADNLLEIAKNIKEAEDHGQKMKESDLDFDFVIGKAKMGARTEAQFNGIDRLTEKIASSKIGGFVNEATIASAVAITYSLGTFVSKRMINNKILAWSSFGATAGLATVFSGLRESRRLEEERRHHAREMAKGKKFDSNKSPRRKGMEEFRQETREANGLTDSLEGGLYNFKDGKKESKQLTQEEFNKTLANLAEIESRVKISDQQKIDLISFSDGKKVDIERLRMDIARAQAKVELRKMIKTNSEFLAGGKSFDELLQSVQETRMKQLIEGDGGIEKRNVLFKKMKHKKVAKSMLKGLAIGLTIGAAAQEIGAVFQGDQEGLMDVRSAFGADGAVPAEAQHYTVLEYLRRLATNDFPKAEGLGSMHALVVGGHHISIPEGSDLIPNPDGSFSLTRGSETLLNHITFDPNGGLSAESRKLLESHGIDAVSSAVPGGALHGHNLATQGVHRTLWYDNDTPKPIFDKNELKLHWGGHQGTGVDSHGNYVFNVKDMTNDGSYHDKVSLSAHDAVGGGKLKMLFSLSQATQNQAVEVPIDAAGNVTIDPHSELGKMLFKTANGHAEFLGKYAEVAEVVGNKDGIDQVRILATHVGHGIGAVKGDPVTIFSVPPGEAPDYIVDPPPFIPIFGRNPLEPTGKEGVGASPARPEDVPSDPAEPSSDNDPNDENEAEKNRLAVEAALAAATAAAIGVAAIGANPESQESVDIIEEIEKKTELDKKRVAMLELLEKRKKEIESVAMAVNAKVAERVSEERDPVRAAAWHTIFKLKSSPDKNLTYAALDGATEQEREEKFKEVTRKLWDEFTVHGMLRLNEKTKKYNLEKKSDLDGESWLKLLELAGLSVDRNKVNFVKPGETARSGLVGDTSGKQGTIAENNGELLTNDHHSPESDRTSSATKLAYEMLTEMGLLKKEAHLDKFVAFVTACDNLEFSPTAETVVYENYAKSLYGLRQKMELDDILQAIKDGVDPAQALPAEYLEKILYKNPKVGEEPLARFAEYFQEKMKKGERIIKGMERNGFVLDTGDAHFGKILIDTNNRTGKNRWRQKIDSENHSDQLAVFAKGYGAYIKWSQPENSFVVFTKRRMDETSIPGGLGQGRNVRGHMWIKSKNGGEPLSVTLESVLAKLSGKDDYKIDGNLKKAIDIDTKTKELAGIIGEKKLTEEILHQAAKDIKVSLGKLLNTMVDQREKLGVEVKKRLEKESEIRERVQIEILLKAKK